MQDEKRLVIIIPCYNEEETVEYSADKLIKKIESLINAAIISPDSGICFVNDGSTDKTYEILNNLADKNKRIAIINLSRNFGQQYALLAGMKTINADMIITLDADLQDSIDVIDEMINKYHEGCEIVYGCRQKRDGDTFLKKFTAESFYKIMKFFCPKIYYNHADYRLMSRKALNLLNEYSEKSVFLRGLIPHIGLNSGIVYYDRSARVYGKTKYNYSKMLEFAWQGITDYSTFPIRLISLTGICLMGISLLLIITLLSYYLKTETIYTAFLLFSFMSLFSGLILLSIGIIGEYIAKILYETKSRPQFQIESTKNL